MAPGASMGPLSRPSGGEQAPSAWISPAPGVRALPALAFARGAWQGYAFLKKEITDDGTDEGRERDDPPGDVHQAR